MADKKISELTNYTPPLDADVIPIVDDSGGATKKLTWANLKATIKSYYDSASSTLTNKTLTSPVINNPTGITTGDLTEDTDKNYVTDAQATVIGNTSGTNTGDQTLGSLGLDSDDDVTFNNVTADNFEYSASNIVTDATTSRTLALSDSGTYIRYTAGSAITVTVPPNGTVAFPIGTQIDMVMAGTGEVTIAEGAGVTVNSMDDNTKLSTQYAGLTIKKVATDEWDVFGLQE